MKILSLLAVCGFLAGCNSGGGNSTPAGDPKKDQVNALVDCSGPAVSSIYGSWKSTQAKGDVKVTMFLTFEDPTTETYPSNPLSLQITSTCAWNDGTNLTAHDSGGYSINGHVLTLSSGLGDKGDTETSGGHSCQAVIPTAAQTDVSFTGSCVSIQGVEYQKVQ